ncbi:MAG: molybdopterin-synthase adenylyltransferase MoeB [Deltaproteobacteria bacterium]|nr:molybdopterin-synthase adenylyltransferase MoeB [Deltaproteobacteria bacterium]
MIAAMAASELRALLDSGERVWLVDVREEHELALGRLPDAQCVPRGVFEERIEAVAPHRDALVVVYCASGRRSLVAARTLLELGYSRVASLVGGFERWASGGNPVVHPTSLTEAQRERYARHLTLAEVGPAGQERLLRARVLVVGVGGLGSPVALYLAAAGVGTLGVVDDDVVDVSNLQRQILHATSRIAMPKIASAVHALRDLNPDVAVVPHRERLSEANAESLVEGYDVVVDASDNFATRYALNEACVRHAIPLVHGSIHRFEGQVTTFVPGGPCYRCLSAEPPPRGAAPSCGELGVLGVLPAVIGSLQATEVVKLLLGIGAPLVERLIRYDALRLRFFEFRYRRESACATCGPHRSSRTPTREEASTPDGEGRSTVIARR